jgi:starch synthase
MRICFVSSECVPFSKTGGLADVSGALPKALADLGCSVKVFTPLYDTIRVFDHGLTFADELRDIPVRVGTWAGTFNVFYGKLPGSEAEVYFIDCPHFYHRGKVYTNDFDEDARFILLQHAAFLVMQRYAWSPDVVHSNDWQSGLMPVYLQKVYGWDGLFRRSASLMTIHNIAYQGLFGQASRAAAGLGNDLAYQGGPYEMHGGFSFMKAGLVFADAVSTVSETYAHEIQTPAYGANLDGIIRARQPEVYGILNGIDTTVWNPATDPHIPQKYTVKTLKRKAENKQALLAEFGMPYHADVPVFGIISRLTGQKGFELLQPILGSLLDQYPMQLIVLGSGESKYEDFFNGVQAAYPHKVGAYIGYNDRLSHWIEAGCDAFIMPSRFEPCGLNQMYSLNYGTVPVVRRTGGLADTVHDFHEFTGHGNGFSFYDFTPHALYTSLLRAIDLFQYKDAWRQVQERGMKMDFSWQTSAEKYMALYEHLMDRKRGY